MAAFDRAPAWTRLPGALVVAFVSAAAASAACASLGDGQAVGFGEDGGPNASSSSSSGGADAGSPLQPQQPTGVMLVHAAEFPPLRVCFEGRPEARPLPDTTTMPDANIVGLDIGTGIRLPPIRGAGRLGKMFVIEIDPTRIRTGFDESATCGELICPPGSRSQCLTEGRDYAVTTAFEENALGADALTILAIRGCGNAFQLTQLGVASAECGPQWDNLAGNISVERIGPLDPRRRAAGVLPVQLVNLAPLLSPAFGAVNVRFGPLDADADAGPIDGGATDGGEADAGSASALEQVAESPPLYTLAPARDLSLPGGDESVYGTRGFVIERKTGSGNAFRFSASLADVQEASAPLELPDAFYAGASSYALLMLGDPRVVGSNDPRRVHLVAVPATGPTAGPDGGATADASADR